jgi:hypothetical protein
MKLLHTFAVLISLALTAGAQTVTITNPVNGSVSTASVTIAAKTTNWNTADHLELWDTLSGQKALKLSRVREHLIGLAPRCRAVPSCYSSHLIPDASPRHFRRWKNAPNRA